MSAEQCALLDTPPQIHMGSFGSHNFPREAMYWVTQGWASVEHDIAADGKVRNARTVLTYPAFVFSEASASAFENARYDATFRPGNDLGCGGVSRTIRFGLPS